MDFLRVKSPCDGWLAKSQIAFIGWSGGKQVASDTDGHTHEIAGRWEIDPSTVIIPGSGRVLIALSGFCSDGPDAEAVAMFPIIAWRVDGHGNPDAITPEGPLSEMEEGEPLYAIEYPDGRWWGEIEAANEQKAREELLAKARKRWEQPQVVAIAR